MKSTLKINCEQCGKHLQEDKAEAYYITLDNYIIVCPQCLKKLLKIGANNAKKKKQYKY